MNDDAVALKKLVDLTINKYGELEPTQLKEQIPNDFEDEYHHISSDYVGFVYKELKEFQFSFHQLNNEDSNNDLMVEGRGKYAGFNLYARGSQWHSSARDGIAYRATGGAKKLVKVLEDKYDIQDMDKLLKGIPR